MDEEKLFDIFFYKLCIPMFRFSDSLHYSLIWIPVALPIRREEERQRKTLARSYIPMLIQCSLLIHGLMCCNFLASTVCVHLCSWKNATENNMQEAVEWVEKKRDTSICECFNAITQHSHRNWTILIPSFFSICWMVKISGDDSVDN